MEKLTEEEKKLLHKILSEPGGNVTPLTQKEKEELHKILSKPMD